MTDLTLPYRTRLVVLGALAAALLGGSMGAAHAADDSAPAPSSTETSTSVEGGAPPATDAAVATSPSTDTQPAQSGGIDASTGPVTTTGQQSSPTEGDTKAEDAVKPVSSDASATNGMSTTARPLPQQAATQAQAAWAARIKKHAEMKATQLTHRAEVQAKAHAHVVEAKKRLEEKRSTTQLKKAVR